MRNLLLPLLIFSLLVSACSKGDDQAEKDDAIIQEYLTTNGIDAQEVEETGVFYIIDSLGTGGEFPNIASQLRIYYTGYFLDGTVFDTNDGNMDRWDLWLSQMIRGWQIALPYFEKGSKGRLFIPSRHAYGSSGSPSGVIPPNTVIAFDIELLNVF